MTPEAVVKAYPRANAANIRKHWPLVLAALAEMAIDSPAVRTAAAATIDVETGGRFEPISEYASGAAYDVGSLAARLGNTPEADGDGQRYKGRGLIQLTGTANYRAAGKAVGMDLLRYPELANDPKTAARIFAWFFKAKGIPAAANAGEWERVRRLVNGGLNGWDRFVSGIRSSVPLEWIRPDVALALLLVSAMVALLIFPEISRRG